MKRIFIVIILIIILGTAGYYFYFKSGKGVVDENQQSTVTPKPELLVSERGISPILSFNAERVWFMTPDGRMYRQAVAGGEKAELVLPEVITSPLEIIWQTKGSDFIVVQNADGHIRYQFYDGEEQMFIPYPEGLRKPVFLAGDEKIAYDWGGPAGHELKVADLDGTNFVKVADLPRGDYELAASPVRQEVVLFAKSEPAAKLLFVNVEIGETREIGEIGTYRGVRFSPDGRFFLSSKNKGDRGDTGLFIYNLDTSREIDLQISGSVEQAAWKLDSSGIILGSETGFGGYDLVAGRWENIYQFESKGQYTPTQIFLHPQESTLFFVDQKTGYLYRLDF